MALCPVCKEEHRFRPWRKPFVRCTGCNALVREDEINTHD